MLANPSFLKKHCELNYAYFAYVGICSNDFQLDMYMFGAHLFNCQNYHARAINVCFQQIQEKKKIEHF